MGTPQPALGRRLKALRASRGLSLREVGLGTGLSTSFLSMVENGRTELTVGRLLKLLDFYGIDLRDLLPEREIDKPVVLRSDERQVVEADDPRVRTEPLARWHFGEMSTAAVRFDPGAELPSSASHAGLEFLLLLSGELAIEFADDTSVVLGEGDSACFEASRRHRCANTGDGEAHLITFKNEQQRGWEGPA